MNQGYGERKLYVAQVPKYSAELQRSKRQISNELELKNKNLPSPDIFLKRDYLEQYDSELLDLNANATYIELCYKQSEFCCNFELEYDTSGLSDNSSHYIYRLAAYDGWRNENAAEKNQLKNCALFACSSENITDCGTVQSIDADVIFNKLIVTASFPIVEQYLLMPNSLKAEDLLPLTSDQFYWEQFVGE